jgi:hypothetical protein
MQIDKQVKNTLNFIGIFVPLRKEAKETIGKWLKNEFELAVVEGERKALKAMKDRMEVKDLELARKGVTE